MSVLKVADLHVNVAGVQILRGVDLEVRSGEVHALMGPNGSGKSTLSHALMGRGDYEVVSGSVTIDGEELLGPPHLAARPDGAVPRDAVPGRGARRPPRGPRRRARSRAAGSTRTDLHEHVAAEAHTLGVPDELLGRGVNDEFSGGEKKRAETVQLAVLEPKFAVLDEIDSGLDVDALRDVARRVERMTNDDGLGVLAITHYARLLTELRPDRVHVMLAGRVVMSGGPELADRLEESGYEGIAAEVGVDTLTVEMPNDADPFSDPTAANNPFADPLA